MFAQHSSLPFFSPKQRIKPACMHTGSPANSVHCMHALRLSLPRELKSLLVHCQNIKLSQMVVRAQQAIENGTAIKCMQILAQTQTVRRHILESLCVIDVGLMGMVTLHACMRYGRYLDPLLLRFGLCNVMRAHATKIFSRMA